MEIRPNRTVRQVLVGPEWGPMPVLELECGHRLALSEADLRAAREALRSLGGDPLEVTRRIRAWRCPECPVERTESAPSSVGGFSSRQISGDDPMEVTIPIPAGLLAALRRLLGWGTYPHHLEELVFTLVRDGVRDAERLRAAGDPVESQVAAP